MYHHHSSDLLSDEEFSDEDDGSDSSSESSEDEPPAKDSPEMEQRKKDAAAKLVPALPAEEYGVMPPSFSNSQPVSAPTLRNETTSAPQDPGTQRPIRKPILM